MHKGQKPETILFILFLIFFLFPRAHNTFAQHQVIHFSKLFSFLFRPELVTLVQYDKVSTGRGFTHLHT